MTDDPTDRPTDDVSDDVSDDANQQAVTRLLAEVRHTAPMPPEVAARLDGVLADLAASRPAPATDTSPQRSAVVVPIDSRRRRRFATALVAAAAVVAVGVALPNLTGGLTGELGGSADEGASDSDSAGTAAESGDQMMREESAPVAPPSESEPSESEPSDPGSDPGGTAETSASPPTVSPESFKQDVRRARPQATALSTATGPVCGVLPPGEVVPVVFDGRTGYLVFTEDGRARERVELYGCPEGELLRQALIPAP